MMDGTLPEEADEAMGAAGATPTNKISVLDDDASIRDSAKTLLRSAGYQVATFAAAESFLKSAELVETECLILDIRMPAMVGPELQKRVSSPHPQTPIIFPGARRFERSPFGDRRRRRGFSRQAVQG